MSEILVFFLLRKSWWKSTSNPHFYFSAGVSDKPLDLARSRDRSNCVLVRKTNYWSPILRREHRTRRKIHSVVRPAACQRVSIGRPVNSNNVLWILKNRAWNLSVHKSNLQFDLQCFSSVRNIQFTGNTIKVDPLCKYHEQACCYGRKRKWLGVLEVVLLLTPIVLIF